MIVVQISSAGIREVVLQARDDATEDVQLALWPLIREELDRLDQRLKREGPQLLERLETGSRGGPVGTAP